MINININSENIPERADNGCSGYDLRAANKEEIIIPANHWKLIPTGIKMEIPVGYEGQIRSRSGLALKNGVMVLNSPGTIDASYRGEIGIILMNFNDVPFVVRPNDRIAQIVFAKVEEAFFSFVDNISNTKRGEGGFGSTGSK